MPAPRHRSSSGSARVAAAAAAAMLVAAGGVAVAAAPSAAAAPSPGLLVNEVYGGGGNSGATLTNDFIELTNRGTTAASLDGYSVQYHSSSGTGAWQVTKVSGSLAAGATYLVAEAKGAGGTTALPTADATGTIAMAAGSGTVALVSNATALTCLSAADCAAAGSVIDLVGSGSAAIAEGAPAATLTNTTSDARTSAPDTDDNKTDFAMGDPTPTNSKGETSGGGTTTPPPPPPTPDHTIADVQGNSWLSPLQGQTVTVAGVVTGVSSNQFFLQEPDADAANAPANTSTAVVIFTRTAPKVAVGNSVAVTGAVSEYYGTSDPSTANLSTTEITSTNLGVTGTNVALPTAIDLNSAPIPNLYAPPTPAGDNNIEHLTLTPSRSVLEYYESHEAMRAGVHDVRVVGPSNQYGETNVTVKPNENPTPRGGVLSNGYAQPTGRVVLATPASAGLHANVGDVISGVTSGPLQWTSFGGENIEVQQLGTYVDNHLPRVPASKQAADQLAIATYNVENLSPADPQSKFDRLAQGVVTYLATPDVVALEEIQDNDGPTDDGVTNSDVTLTKFTDAIVAAGGPRYQWRYIAPTNDEDGGQPGGNIRNVFLFNPARTSFVDNGTPSATTATQVIPGRFSGPALTLSPGRINPTDPAWTDSRKPLVGQFTFRGKAVFVIANHFDSKGGDQSADGRFQPPTRSSEIQRQQQATLVHDFVANLERNYPTSPVVVVGDLNDYQYSPAVKTLTNGRADGRGFPVLLDLINYLPKNQQYTYVFNGVSQVLDHILISPSAVLGYSYQPVHINAEYSDQASDHDPQVVRIKPLFFARGA